MAILDPLPGLEVTVRVNGEPAREYDDPDHNEAGRAPETPSCKKYIESKSGATFSLVISATQKAQELLDEEAYNVVLEFSVRIDGIWREGQIMRRHTFPYTMEIRGARAPSDEPGMYELQLFKFKDIMTVDDASSARMERDKEIAKDVGIMEVRVFKSEEAGSSFTPYSTRRGEFELSEKSLKGRSISHGTDYISGGLQADAGTLSMASRRLIGRFYFQYRSRNDLKAELIIPRSPTPEVAVRDDVDDVENLSPRELRRLAGERLAQINGNATIKSERRRGVKREGSPSGAQRNPTPYKILRTNDGRDMIDLTDD